MLQIYSLAQGSLVPAALTNYTIMFTPVNPLPSTGSIQLTYPQQIALNDGYSTVCTVTTS